MLIWMMHFFNHYSAPIVAALLLAGGLSVVLRRGGRIRHWLMLGGVIVALGIKAPNTMG